MQRRLFTFAAALALMLCAATVVMWMRSHQRWEWVSWQARSGRLYTITSRIGALDAGVTDGWPFGEVFPGRWHVASDSVLVDSLPSPQHSFVGIGVEEQTYQIGSVHTTWTGTARRRALIVPYWAIVLALGILSAACMTPLLRERRRRARGLCRRCGYDLRASPRRCPECGEPNFALSSANGVASIGGMADQKQNQQQQKSSSDTRKPGKDDPRHAPESGEPQETGRADQQGARGDRTGDRDESGRQGAGR